MQWLFLNSTVHSCLFMHRFVLAQKSVRRKVRVNCIVLECIRQVITQVPLGSDPVGFLDAGIPHEGRIMAVGADQDGNGSFGDFFPEVRVWIRPAVVVP